MAMEEQDNESRDPSFFFDEEEEEDNPTGGMNNELLFHEHPIMMDMDTAVVSSQQQSQQVVPKTASKTTEEGYHCSNEAATAETSPSNKEQLKLMDELQSYAVSSMKSGDFVLAEEIFRHLLHLQLQQQQQQQSNEILTTLANIGKCCEVTGRLQEAMSCYREALQMKSHDHKDLHLEPASVQLLLASILYDIGMIHSKLLFATTTGPHNKNNNSTVTTTTVDDKEKQQKKGDLVERAIRAFFLALRLRQECTCLNKDDEQQRQYHYAVASVLHNIGIVLTVADMPSASIGYHEKALAIRRSTFGRCPHPEVASSLRHLATSHKALGNYRAASGYLLEALDILKCIPCGEEGFPQLREVMIELSHVKRALL